MRLQAKPNAKLGISAANAYRSSVRSAATDLEGLVDGYGPAVISILAWQIYEEIAKHGDSTRNTEFNLWLNAQPIPAIRKLNKSENKRRRR